MTETCPCGADVSLRECCAEIISGTRLAATAEQLMRSRYTAFVIGEADHVWRSWHPRTRPHDIVLDPSVVWTGLQIEHTDGGGPDDDTGVVEFTASYRDSLRHEHGQLHERSRFAKRANRWFYLDADPDLEFGR